MSRPIGIVELLTRIGDENVRCQFPLTDGSFISCNKRKHYDELSFAAYPGLALEMVTGKVSRVGIVLWIDAEILKRAMEAAKAGVPLPRTASPNARDGWK